MTLSPRRRHELCGLKDVRDVLAAVLPRIAEECGNHAQCRGRTHSNRPAAASIDVSKGNTEQASAAALAPA